MFNTKPIIQFIAVFLLSYVVLMVIGTQSEETYAKKFRGFGKTFFSEFKDIGRVWFEEHKESTEKHFNTKLTFFNQQQYDKAGKKGERLKAGSITASSWYTGFLPTILLISLIVASPVSWKRKGIALLLGLLLVHLFIWFQARFKTLTI